LTPTVDRRPTRLWRRSWPCHAPARAVIARVSRATQTCSSRQPTSLCLRLDLALWASPLPESHAIYIKLHLAYFDFAFVSSGCTGSVSTPRWPMPPSQCRQYMHTLLSCQPSTTPAHPWACHVCIPVLLVASAPIAVIRGLLWLRLDFRPARAVDPCHPHNAQPNFDTDHIGVWKPPSPPASAPGAVGRLLILEPTKPDHDVGTAAGMARTVTSPSLLSFPSPFPPAAGGRPRCEPPPPKRPDVRPSQLLPASTSLYSKARLYHLCRCS